MFRILKTINQIFIQKKKSENPQYIKGFSDCFELLKIGIEKMDDINLHLENNRLKHILYNFLYHEFSLSDERLSRIKELVMRYDEEYIFLDHLLTNSLVPVSANFANSKPDEVEIKMQNIILTEIIFKLIKHDFQLTKRQINKIRTVADSNNRVDHKIQEILNILSVFETGENWVDYETVVEQRNTLSLQNKLLNQVVEHFVYHYISKYEHYELRDIFTQHLPPAKKYQDMLFYLKKIKKEPLIKLFELSEEQKADIEKIFVHSEVTNESLQELYNFINFILPEYEKITFSKLKKSNIKKD